MALRRLFSLRTTATSAAVSSASRLRMTARKLTTLSGAAKPTATTTGLSQRSMATAKPAASAPAAPAAAVSRDFVGVVGETNDHFFDVANARVGQDVAIPYEVTVSEGARELWQSCFYQHDRLYTSTPFAQRLNFKAHALPFTFMLFQTVSMSHIDDRREVLDLGFSNAVYVRAAFAGDTFKRAFYVKNVRPTTAGHGTIITMHCSLFNQKNELVFEVDKTMLFPDVVNSAARKTAIPQVASAVGSSTGTGGSGLGSTILPVGLQSEFEKQIMQWASSLPSQASSRAVTSGQLVLHTSARPLGKSMNRSLSTLLRFQHPLLMNLARYDTELVPGPLVLGLTMAASARGLYDTLYEFVQSSVLINKVEPNDTIGAITYVHSVNELTPGLEEVRVTTLGVKNLDVRKDLTGVRIPLSLFGADPKAAAPAPAAAAASSSASAAVDANAAAMRGVGAGPRVVTRGEVARITTAQCPVLNDKVVAQVSRRLLRQSRESPFAMALL